MDLFIKLTVVEMAFGQEKLHQTITILMFMGTPPIIKVINMLQVLIMEVN